MSNAESTVEGLMKTLETSVAKAKQERMDWGDTNQAILAEVGTERRRAHEKHGATSMESSAPDTYRRLAILTEEVGEVAREFNDAEHEGRPVDLTKLRKELIQVAAMAVAWADACPCETKECE